MQVVLYVVTVGLYALYWFYKTAKQFDEGTDQDLSPVLGLVPVVNILVAWQIANAAEAVTDQSAMVIFVLFLLFPILPWYWVQDGINSVAPS